MFGRKRSPKAPADPSVARVEVILAAATGAPAALTAGPVPTATHALSICACVGTDDALTWLIYDADGGGVAWRRVAARVEASSLVAARRRAAGHADPAEVLRWLAGEATDPWSGGEGWGEAIVLEELGRKLRS